jgi:hypothetical protein
VGGGGGRVKSREQSVEGEGSAQIIGTSGALKARGDFRVQNIESVKQRAKVRAVSRSRKQKRSRE